MKVEVDHALQQFSWRQPGGEWQAIGPKLDAAVISDEGGRGGHGSFTGAFVGMFAMDMTGQGREARISHRFAYLPMEHEKRPLRSTRLASGARFGACFEPIA
jgi:xylan 1,4-beta-xylosidase